MRRDFALLYTCLVGTLLAGCSGASSPTSAPAGDAGSAADSPLGTLVQQGDQSYAALALYRVRLDPGTLEATSALVATRSAQGVNNNDALYLLSIAEFMTADTFRVRGITRTPDTIDLRYTVTHPFAGPTNPLGLPSGINRTDLGITGMALFLLDAPAAPGKVFFDDGAGQRVIADTNLITNADAFWAPAGLLTQTGTANTFPYKVLVDESGPDGAREGISNGGLVTGNYGTDGWILNELGAGEPFNQWTGYGVLHQGQAATQTVSFSRTRLDADGPVAFNVALVAKYTDPRAGSTTAQKRANRLPAIVTDPTSTQAYREPHGALDCQAIRFLGQSSVDGFIANELSAATLGFYLEDWDARAIESLNPDLSTNSIVTDVAPGEAGLPAFALCLPGILNADVADAGPSSQVTFDPFADVLDDDSAVGGDPATDSGAPGDALFYSKAITKPVTAGQTEGTYTGLVRAIDPEELLPGGHLSVALDGITLQPITSSLPHSITYQALTVELAPQIIDPPMSCIPDLPFAGTPVGASQANYNVYQSIPPPGTGTNSAVNLDVAAFPDTRFSPAGGIVMQNYNTAGGFPYDFWLSVVNNGAPFNTSSWIQLTNLGAGFTTRSLQIECDTTGRIIFSAVGGSYPGGWGGGGHVYGAPSQKYTAGATGAAADLFWFDPVTSGPLPSTVNTISTGAVIPVALTLDMAGNIYGIDQNNVLHQWDKALSYELDPLDSGYPKDLATIPEIGPPSERKIQDFVYNERNQEFLMLWQPDDNIATIVKLECDLTAYTVSDEGGFGSAGWNLAADIGIDQVDATGALLADQGEAQVYTSSSQYYGIKVFRADDLTEYQAATFPCWLGEFYHPSFTIALNGSCGGPSSSWTGCIIGYGVPVGGPNAGWQ